MACDYGLKQNRRRFLQGGLLIAGAGLLTACGGVPPLWQRTAKIPRVGYLELASQSTYPIEWFGVFREALGQLGYVEDRSIQFDYRFADNRADRLFPLATELVRDNVDVLVVRGAQASQAAQRATATVPIVMAYTSDPVELGLVASLARPGGNITGSTSLSPDLAPKRLQLLKEISPAMARVGVLYNPDNPGIGIGYREAVSAAGTLGLQIHGLAVHDLQLAESLAAAISERIDALVILGGTNLSVHRDAIVGFAAQQRLPAMHDTREWVVAEGLMSYGVSFAGLFRRAAYYVDKILKGTRPADLPVEHPTTFELAINLKTAQVLGLTIPPSVLQQATEIIE